MFWPMILQYLYSTIYAPLLTLHWVPYRTDGQYLIVDWKYNGRNSYVLTIKSQYYYLRRLVVVFCWKCFENSTGTSCVFIMTDKKMSGIVTSRGYDIHDLDIDELVEKLTPGEIQKLLDDCDPDDSQIPPSLRWGFYDNSI